MPALRPILSIFGIKVFLPASSVFGLVLIAWFAIPTSSEALGLGASEAAVLIVALVHAVMLYLSVLVHELGHALSARRYGYPVDGITLTIIGGHTQIAAEYRRPRHQFWVALAGPFGTLLVAAAAWLATLVTSGLAHSILVWLAWSSILIGGVNLLPGIPLDGGAALDALVWHKTKKRWRGRQVAAISGFAVAALWASTPWILAAALNREVVLSDIIVSGLVGLWMASVAWRVYIYALAEGAGLTRLPVDSETPVSVSEPIEPPSPVVHIRPYVRRSIAIDSSVPLDQALQQAAGAAAGAIVVTKDATVVGVVRDAAVAAVPEEKRSTVAVSSVARRVAPDEALSVDTVLAELVTQLQDPAIQEWVVLDTEGAVYGVLIKADVQGKLNV